MELQKESLGKASITEEGEHSTKREYTPHSIVNDLTLGISAISKMPVPVGVPLTDTRFWMWLGSLDKQIVIDYATFKSKVEAKYAELEKYYKEQVEELKAEFDSLKATSEFGVILSDHLGNDENVGVSQKALTRIINEILNKMRDATGELPDGVEVIIIPDYILSDTAADVSVRANAGDGTFDYLKIYVNDKLVIEQESIDKYEDTIQIEKTSVIKVVVSMLGTEYESSKTITSYYPFFIGSGTEWKEVVKTENLRQYTGVVDGKYQIKVEHAGDKMFVIIPTSLGADVERITMSGFEIPCDIITDSKYIIYQSRNTYRQGVFELDINIVTDGLGTV